MIQSRPIEVSVIAPTFNEASNVARLVDRIARTMRGIGWEIIFVDDNSPDHTADLVADIARIDRRVRIVQRIGRRGLASACIEGFLASPAPYVGVIDADLQHDETLLPKMLDLVRAGDADCVVASRYLLPEHEWRWNEQRAAASRLATRITRLFTATTLSDPMSGYFLVRRDAVLPLIPRLSGTGFKILLDIVLTAPRSFRVCELPGQFQPRESGESKFDSRAMFDFVLLLLEKTVGRWIPARFVVFSLIGTAGIAVHLSVLWLLFRGLSMSFIEAQAVATILAMTFNFLLNNELTYRDRRLRGLGMLRGWASFGLGCSIGLLANVGVAAELFAADRAWWLAALGGIAVGAVWNYAVTSFYTWGKA